MHTHADAPRRYIQKLDLSKNTRFNIFHSSKMANITKNFLEKALQKPIESFECNSGSSVGDGYTSLLYTIDVTLPASKEEEKEVVHIFLKCYSAHAGRHEWLSQNNVFQRELSFYNTFIPALVQFQKTDETTSVTVKTPFPKLIFGQAIDYTESKDSTKVCSDVLDNCIILPDLRKTGNYRLVDQVRGFDLDHLQLAIEALAKFHALSWAYKVKQNVSSLAQKFPFLNSGTFYDTLYEGMFEGIFDNGVHLFCGVIETFVKDDGEKAKLIQSINRARSTVMDVAALYSCDQKQPSSASINKDNILRVPGVVMENEEPWLVATHVDTRVNNMMFRYDKKTGKPIEVMLIDLQYCREGDPMTDLTYCIYTSTTSELRQKHLNDLLQLYVDSFLQVCQTFNVAPLPGFQLAETQRRFHRAKAFGFVSSLMGLPIFLAETQEEVDKDKLPEGTTGDELAKEVAEMVNHVANSPIFQSRVLGIVREFYDEGVI